MPGPGGRPGGGMGGFGGGMGPMGPPRRPMGPPPPPRRGWGYRRGWGGCCFPGCCMYLLGAGGVIALIAAGIGMLIM